MRDAIAAGDTACGTCHDLGSGGGHEALHTTTVPESCAGEDCHSGTSLTSIHMTAPATSTCDTCHDSTDPNVTSAVANHDKNCSSCHGSAHADSGSHRVHVDASIPRGPGGLVCGDCHDTNAMPLFKDGQTLAQTTVCNTCHSPGGSFDGVDSADGSVGAKDKWAFGVYDAMTTTPRPGNERWCVGCHDEIPAIIGGAPALNKAGDDATFGYFVTGHGRETTYPAGSYQALADPGNKPAGKQCTACHEAGLPHINIGVQSDRLMPGIENDLNNSNCRACHDSGGAASSPEFYTDYTGFENAAHGRFKCTDCHDPHGAPGGGTQMTVQS
ncbi:MAG: hypothetical protein HY876_04100, partial [Coriobacteriales bacterium]|nr:hypothetical protein [Coriobacteriales bacterium]